MPESGVPSARHRRPRILSPAFSLAASCGDGEAAARSDGLSIPNSSASCLYEFLAVSLFSAVIGEAGPPRLPAAAREVHARLRPPGPYDAARVHHPRTAARSTTAESRVEHLDPRELRRQQSWPRPRRRHARHVVDQRLAEDVCNRCGAVAGDVLDLVELLEPDPTVPLSAPRDADDQRRRDVEEIVFDRRRLWSVVLSADAFRSHAGTPFRTMTAAMRAKRSASLIRWRRWASSLLHRPGLGRSCQSVKDSFSVGSKSGVGRWLGCSWG